MLILKKTSRCQGLSVGYETVRPGNREDRKEEGVEIAEITEVQICWDFGGVLTRVCGFGHLLFKVYILLGTHISPLSVAMT